MTTLAKVWTVLLLAAANLPAQSSVARTGQANTFSTDLQDLSGATLKIPTASGFTASAASMFGFDSTAGAAHFWSGGADHTLGTAAFSASSAFQTALSNYSTISSLTGYPSTFPPTTTGLCLLTGCTFSGAIIANGLITANNSYTIAGTAPFMTWHDPVWGDVVVQTNVLPDQSNFGNYLATVLPDTKGVAWTSGFTLMLLLDKVAGTQVKGKFLITTAQTPATSSATCTTGQIAWDTGFIYVCTATNTWKRTLLSTF